MKSLDDHSGPWRGWSIQDGIRITEAMRFNIRAGWISGEGTDKDGDFTMEGSYDTAGTVRMVRRYVRTTIPSVSGTWILYDYAGKWDGEMISGRWSPQGQPFYGGPFEMWPEDPDAELRLESMIEQSPLAAV